MEAFTSPRNYKPRTFALIAVLCAVVTTGALFLGYYVLRRRHAATISAIHGNSVRSSSAKTGSNTSTGVAAAPTLLSVSENEAFLKGSQAIISGTVRNVSARQLSRLAIEFELIPRDKGERQTRLLALAPETLGPNAEARYNLPLPSNAYRGARILRITSSAANNASDEVAFTTAAGQRRSKQAPPADVAPLRTKTPNNADDEFLNSAEHPVSLP